MTLPVEPSSTVLLVTALVAVLVLIALISARLNAFVAIFLTSLGLAAASHKSVLASVRSFEVGFGNTLGHVAIVVGLGTMLGKMLTESGGAECIGRTLVQRAGNRALPFAMMLCGLVVGLPVFFEVGFVLLMPLAFTVSRQTGKSLLVVAMPMVIGLSVAHGLMPPHPAAMIAVTAYGANVGKTIGYALLIGIPTAVLAGPVYSGWVAKRVPLQRESPMAAEMGEVVAKNNPPSFLASLSVILLPAVLMVAGSWADLVSSPASRLNQLLRLVGNADIALLITVLVSFVALGTLRGMQRGTILQFSNEALAPTALITLLVGAGGGFGRILQDSGVSQALVGFALHLHISVLLLGWFLAAMLRCATGSATVAMTAAAEIVAPIALHTPGVHPELLAIATGAGALGFSHVNDGGFWLVKEYFGMSISETFKTWSVCETLIAFLGLAFAMGLSAIL